MDREIDINRLREALKDYYGTAMTNGCQLAVIGLSEIENASDDEVVELAVRNGLELERYINI